ncbi:chalcone isomerase family protein [Sedimenticola selenatireducens]|uniref:Chalcone isomerase domain-containing protein n=1 Tax=Sedimenticola selenatireducens TaxID=191960 RepID=A0A558DVZ6_9GAMM|nr:chalcone isomerase family protein [Sedimenticola selenatireducens]TVO77901.1 hypothetical protein FHP88_03635 [Sedimenticola selenatireducens]TVT65206.1 MAG: hypothetical protein FHK78_06000 [Sedimenticola selenatireducens]
MSRFARECLFGILLLVLTGSASATKFENLLGQVKPVGSGELSFWGMTIYRATLLAPEGRYQADQLHALQIDYQSSFSRNQLTWASVNHMEPLLESYVDRQSLYQQLSAVLRDVEAGDQITGVHHPDEGAVFYSNGQLIGRLHDPAVAAAFFSIWLDPRTREPDLRARLLGQVR